MRQITSFFGLKQKKKKIVGSGGLTTDLYLPANSFETLPEPSDTHTYAHTHHARELAWDENGGPAKVSTLLSSLRSPSLTPGPLRNEGMYVKQRPGASRPGHFPGALSPAFIFWESHRVSTIGIS